MKNLMALMVFSMLISCSKNPNTPTERGVWSLVSSTDKNDRYYQIKIDKNEIIRLFEHGDIIQDKNTITGTQLFLSSHPLTIQLLQPDKLEISDNSTTHIFQRIELIEDCYCTDFRFFHNKFNFEINSITSHRDSSKIDSLKNVMWDYFSGDIHFKSDLEGVEDIIIE